ncbi:RodZ domain-containing protein [Nitrincola alkalisediminis]|nr:RodZ domain-containing protein [Nitrincola alkalisediminis]
MERESKHLTLSQVATDLHLMPKVIAAIESSKPQTFHNPVFMRGYIRNYANYLGLDAKKYTVAFERLGTVNLAPPVIKSTNSVKQRDPFKVPFARGVSWLFVLTMLGVIFWWSQEQYRVVPSDASSLTATMTDIASESERLIDEGFLAPDALISDGNPIEDSVGESESPSVAEVVEETVEEVVEEIVEILPVIFDGLDMSFTNECWVQVRDSSGKTIYSAVANRGDQVQIAGSEPLSVIVGRVDAVASALYKGTIIDVSSLTNTNVARFTLPLNP